MAFTSCLEPFRCLSCQSSRVAGRVKCGFSKLQKCVASVLPSTGVIGIEDDIPLMEQKRCIVRTQFVEDRQSQPISHNGYFLAPSDEQRTHRLHTRHLFRRHYFGWASIVTWCWLIPLGSQGPALLVDL